MELMDRDRMASLYLTFSLYFTLFVCDRKTERTCGCVSNSLCARRALAFLVSSEKQQNCMSVSVSICVSVKL